VFISEIKGNMIFTVRNDIVIIFLDRGVNFFLSPRHKFFPRPTQPASAHSCMQCAVWAARASGGRGKKICLSDSIKKLITMSIFHGKIHD